MNSYHIVFILNVVPIIYLVVPHSWIHLAASVHVAFGGRSETSTSLTKWGRPKEGIFSKTEDLVLHDSAQSYKQNTVSSLLNSATDETGGGPLVCFDTSHQKLEKDYIEPWVTTLCNIFYFPPNSLAEDFLFLYLAGLQPLILSCHSSLKEALFWRSRYASSALKNLFFFGILDTSIINHYPKHIINFLVTLLETQSCDSCINSFESLHNV